MCEVGGVAGSGVHGAGSWWWSVVAWTLVQRAQEGILLHFTSKEYICAEAPSLLARLGVRVR